MTVSDTGIDGRSTARIRNRVELMRAASDLFARRGYRGTTTKDIAAAAGITERTLFRHVPTKAALFRQAVIEPMAVFVDEFVTEWQRRPVGSRDVEIEVREFFDNLLTALGSEYNLLVALMASVSEDGPEPADDTEALPEIESTLAPLMDHLTEIFAVEARTRDWHLDAAIAPRLIVGMAFSVILHPKWLFAGHAVPPQSELVEQLTRLTTWGLVGQGHQADLETIVNNRV